MSESAAILAAIAQLREELRTLAPQPVAVKRADAARLMGISVTKLDALIRTKKIRTAEDSHLVPMAEIRRYCAPKAPRQRKPAVGHRARRSVDGQSDEAIAEMKRALRAAR